MLDVVFFVVAAALASGITIGPVKGILFSFALLVVVLIAPILLIFVIGTPMGLVRRFLLHSTADDDPVKGFKRDIRAGKIVGGVSEILAYLAIIGFSYHLGRPYLWGSIAGICAKLLVDSLWGDLPFQKTKQAHPSSE